MPDLNLIDEGGLEESSAPAAAPASSSGGGGGASRTILIVILVILIGAVAVFFLNKKGIIKLWGKKPAPAMTEVHESDFPPEQMEQGMGEEAQAQQQAPATDSSQVALVETPPVDEYKQVPQSGGEVSPAEAQPKTDKPAPAGAESAKLAEMKGEYTIQVIAFKEKGKADEIQQRLADAGYPSFVETIPMKGGDWFTVRIGRYPTRTEAKKAVASFAEQLRSSYVIDKVRTK